MIKRGYDKVLSVGCIMAGGLLGIIIPPSLEVIVYASMTGESVGRMYLGTFVPGLILAALYILYISIRCGLQPELGPPIPVEARMSWIEKIFKLKGVISPLILLVAIMGGIYSGAVSPMEASAVGATGAIIAAFIHKRLTRKVLKEAVGMTLRISAMAAWLLIGIGVFTSVYSGIGALDLAEKIAGSMPGKGWGVIILTQLSLIIFGMFLDDWAVIMIFAPIFVSVIKTLGFDSLWYGVLFMVNIQLAFLTPPYGFALFCMRAAVPDGIEISMREIYRAAIPFIGLQFICLLVIMLFPSLTTWLPQLFIR
jgi:tripartite ATP-independent transporter DctM subunit